MWEDANLDEVSLGTAYADYWFLFISYYLRYPLFFATSYLIIYCAHYLNHANTDCFALLLPTRNRLLSIVISGPYSAKVANNSCIR